METFRGADGRLNVAIVENPFVGNRTESPGQGIDIDLSPGPKDFETGGLEDVLLGLNCNLKGISVVGLTPEQDKERGTWDKFGYSSGHLRQFVADNKRNGCFTVGLLASCSSLLGMLAGLQHACGTKLLRVGLVWISARGNFNTPETTGSGLLQDMAVAVAAGQCLNRLRLRAGLDPALPTKYIVMAGQKDIDPFERDLIDRTEIEFLSSDDIVTASESCQRQIRRLSDLTDAIYIHVDMGVLDPAEMPGLDCPVPGGPTSEELGSALNAMFRCEKAAAFGITAAPVEADQDGKVLRTAYRLIEGAIQGVMER